MEQFELHIQAANLPWLGIEQILNKVLDIQFLSYFLNGREAK